MGNPKRNPRTYKVYDEVYEKAVKRAKKEKGFVTTLVENVVTCYANGLEIKAIKSESGKATALDVFSLDHSEVINATKP